MSDDYARVINNYRVADGGDGDGTADHSEREGEGEVFVGTAMV
jgi:hypothetical protein